MLPNKLCFTIFFIRAFIPTVITGDNLPHYSEYLHRLKSISTRPIVIDKQKALEGHIKIKGVGGLKAEEAPAAIKAAELSVPQFPAIPLCKGLPKEAGLPEHLFCWSMIGLFSLSVFSLIVYQVRSLLWLKLTLGEHKKVKQEKKNKKPQKNWESITTLTNKELNGEDIAA